MRLIYDGIDLGDVVAVVAIEEDGEVVPDKNGKPLYGAVRIDVEVTLPPGAEE